MTFCYLLRGCHVKSFNTISPRKHHRTNFNIFHTNFREIAVSIRPQSPVSPASHFRRLGASPRRIAQTLRRSTNKGDRFLRLLGCRCEKITSSWALAAVNQIGRRFERVLKLAAISGNVWARPAGKSRRNERESCRRRDSKTHRRVEENRKVCWVLNYTRVLRAMNIFTLGFVGDVYYRIIR